MTVARVLLVVTVSAFSAGSGLTACSPTPLRPEAAGAPGLFLHLTSTSAAALNADTRWSAGRCAMTTDDDLEDEQLAAYMAAFFRGVAVTVPQIEPGPGPGPTPGETGPSEDEQFARYMAQHFRR